MPQAGSTRVRLRRAVAALAAVAVVALGLIPAQAAYAANGNVTATILDKDNNPLTSQMVVEFPGGSTMGVTPDVNGEIDLALPAGTYTLRTWDISRYPLWQQEFTVVDDQTTPLGVIKLSEFPSVTLSVPDALAHDIRVHTYRWTGSYWANVSVLPYAPNSNGDLEIWFSDPDGQWTLEFIADDSIPYMTTYLGGTTVPAAPGGVGSFQFTAEQDETIHLGEVNLVPAGVISGTVTGYGVGPLSDAYVVATDGDDNYVAETQTDESGNYTLKVPLNEELAVHAYADDWQLEYYNDARSITTADKRTLTSGNASWTPVDFQLFPDVTARFDIYADQGGGPAPYDVNSWLYYNSGGGYSPVPFEIDWEDATARFSELPAGEYRLGLQLVDESGWIPFATTNTVPGDLPGATSSCYFQFVVNGNDIDIEFDLLADPASTTCTDAPWVEGAATPGTVTGTVDDFEFMTGPVTATLYTPDQYGEPFPILSSAVGDDGTFALAGVYVDGEYYVGVEVGDTDPFLDTLFGLDDRLAMWQIYDDHIDGVPLTAGVDHAIGTLPLFPASVLTGVVTLRGEPVADVCVELESATTGDYITCDDTDANGRYHLKAPVPGQADDDPFEYRILAYPDGAVFPTYYGDEWFMGEIILVTEPGIDPTQYDIVLVTMPSFIVGEVNTWDADNGEGPVPGGVAHLYQKSGTSWVSVDSFALTQGDWVSEFAFPSELIDVLEGADFLDLFELPSVGPGDYRIYFSQDTTWLPIIEYYVAMATVPTGYVEIESTTPTCFISLENFALDTIAFVDYSLVDTASTINCAPPAPPAPGGGGTPSPKPPKSVTPLIQLVNDAIDDAGEEGTEEPDEGEEPAVLQPTTPPAPSATPSPAPDPDADGAGGARADLAWLWWAGGILLLVIIAGGTVLVLRRP